jgi:carboxylesterase
MSPPLTAAPLTLDRHTADAVLLVHGLGGAPYEVQRLAEALTLTARCLVLPGHEVRGARMPHSTWEQWRQALATEYEQLAARHATVHLVGFSTGAPLVLQLAQAKALTGRLVLLAPFMQVFRPAFAPMRTEALLRVVPFLRSVPRRAPPLPHRDLRHALEGLSAFRTFSLDSTRSALELIAHITPELSRTQNPTLIIQGRRDTVVSPAGAHFLAERLPRARLELVDSDHLLTLDRDAAHVITSARTFLERLG